MNKPEIHAQLKKLSEVEQLHEKARMAGMSKLAKLYRKRLRRERKVLRILAGAETRMDRAADFIGRVLGGAVG